jgi:hypothetical protein
VSDDGATGSADGAVVASKLSETCEVSVSGAVADAAVSVAEGVTSACDPSASEPEVGVVDRGVDADVSETDAVASTAVAPAPDAGVVDWAISVGAVVVVSCGVDTAVPSAPDGCVVEVVGEEDPSDDDGVDEDVVSTDEDPPVAPEELEPVDVAGAASALGADTDVSGLDAGAAGAAVSVVCVGVEPASALVAVEDVSATEDVAVAGSGAAVAAGAVSLTVVVVSLTAPDAVSVGAVVESVVGSLTPSSPLFDRSPFLSAEGLLGEKSLELGCSTVVWTRAP